MNGLFILAIPCLARTVLTVFLAIIAAGGMPMKKILSIDGGGIRGVIPARILAFMEPKIGPIAKAFDLIAGTSTGGILAAGLVHNHDGIPTYRAADMVDLYVNEGPKIFHREWWDPAAALKVKYPAEQIQPVLQRYFEDMSLSSALTDTLITAFDQGKWQPRLFKSREAKADASKDCALWYAARATSAAPTYFPNIDDLVDGGMIGATNPAGIALIEARIVWPGEDIFLWSIGTGRKQEPPISSASSAEWGQLQYLASLVEMFMEGPEAIVERTVQESLPPGQSVRTQALFTGKTPDSAMDAASPQNISVLIAFADQIITDQAAALDHVAVKVAGVRL